ncbi:ATP-dependent nuclease [Fictibacillus sp. 26RED30]|uniref:ATP-dependent nuclease n=1 Tax=Fictibacillus sp. 26RED30 TaxID=2745877 RepID=UPI0018CCF60B|nr:AAA family ATPase [Fictibacillus sp. 26RED30]MBH0160428.1 ATP-binding protein [Fictibacillus sp. 26RED30]
MKLSKVELKNYKSIKHINLDVTELTAIVGKNNYGKSAILDSIQCFYGEKSIGIDNYHMGKDDDIEIILTFNEITESDIERFFNYTSMRNKTQLKIKGLAGDHTKIEKELKKLEQAREKKFKETIEKLQLSYPDQHDFTIHFSSPKNGNSVYKINHTHVIVKGDLFKFIPPIKVISAIRTPDKETTAGTKSNMKELISLLQDGSDSEDFIVLPQIEKKLSYEEIKSLISEKEEVKCEFLSEDITKNFQQAINTESLSVKVKIDNTFKFDFKYKTVLIDKELPEREIDILSCGTGLQSMMILSILQTYIKINSHSDFILLIEEPEVYLHPSLQRKMINTLTEISENNQVLLTTHSPIIVSKINKESVHCVSKDIGVSQLVNATADILIDELGIQTSDILNKNAVIFVEGKDDYIFFKGLINKIAIVKGFSENFSEKEIDIIQTDGFDKMSFYANAKILHKDSVKTPFWVITDSDGENVEDRTKLLMESGLSNGLNIDEKQFKILKEYAIESYFLHPSLLHSVFPDLNEEDLLELCEVYFIKYTEEIHKLKNNQTSKSNFRKNYKPKIMFSNLGKPEHAIEHIIKTSFTNQDNFKTTRLKLIEMWEQKEEPISYVLEKCSIEFLKETRMKEVILVLEEIVDCIAIECGYLQVSK